MAVGGWAFGYQYEFGQPSYDSGWVAFAQNEMKTPRAKARGFSLVE